MRNCICLLFNFEFLKETRGYFERLKFSLQFRILNEIQFVYIIVRVKYFYVKGGTICVILFKEIFISPVLSGLWVTV